MQGNREQLTNTYMSVSKLLVVIVQCEMHEVTDYQFDTESPKLLPSNKEPIQPCANAGQKLTGAWVCILELLASNVQYTLY